MKPLRGCEGSRSPGLSNAAMVGTGLSCDFFEGRGRAGDCKEAIHRFEEKGDILEKVNILRNCSRIKVIVDVLRIVAP